MNQSQRILTAALTWAAIAAIPETVYPALAPDGVLNDEQTSIVYVLETGAIGVDAPPGRELLAINIDSAASIFTGEDCVGLGGFFDNCADNNIYKATFGHGFGSFSLGNISQAGLSQDFVLNDLTVIGALAGGGDLGFVDLVYTHLLVPGDANQDFRFDQQDIVLAMQSNKYLTGQPATWGEGDWNGGPGGYLTQPPVGDGVFDQRDIIAAQQAGTYLTGAYAAIRPNGKIGDEQTSIIYDPSTGEIAVDAPASQDLTSIVITSSSSIFNVGADCPLIGSFGGPGNCDGFEISRISFGSSFGSMSFGDVASPGLSEQFVVNDLTVIGSLAGGGDLGDVDLIYVPEATSIFLLVFGALAVVARARCQHID